MELITKRFRLHTLPFSVFLKFMLYVNVSFGGIVGVLFLIAGLLGADIKTTINGTEQHGFSAGLASIFISPFVFGIFGVILGLVMYLPFRLALRLTKGFVFEATVSDERVWVPVEERADGQGAQPPVDPEDPDSSTKS